MQARKAELGLAEWPDAAIIAQVNEIATALMAAGMHAADRGDQGWLERHRWFSGASERMFDDQHALPLDG